MIVEDHRRNRPIFVSALLDDSDLDPFEFRLYCRLSRRSNSGRGSAFESVENMRKALNMGEHKLRACLRVLVERCFIRAEEKPGFATVYHLLDEEEWRRIDGTPYIKVTPGLTNQSDLPVTDQSDLPVTDQSDKGGELKGEQKKGKEIKAAAATQSSLLAVLPDLPCDPFERFVVEQIRRVPRYIGIELSADRISAIAEELRDSAPSMKTLIVDFNEWVDFQIGCTTKAAANKSFDPIGRIRKQLISNRFAYWNKEKSRNGTKRLDTMSLTGKTEDQGLSVVDRALANIKNGTLFK